MRKKIQRRAAGVNRSALVSVVLHDHAGDGVSGEVDEIFDRNACLAQKCQRRVPQLDRRPLSDTCVNC